jgi:hypothetical protein
MSALRGVFDCGPLKDLDDVCYPVVGRSATFSAKLKALQKSDSPDLDVDDPFPFLFDGRNMGARKDAILEPFPSAQLTDFTMLAVETNISTYSIPAKQHSPGRTGYTMSLRSAYVIGDAPPTFGDVPGASPPNRKRAGDSLVSPRKRKAGQLVVFSDED